MSSAKARLQDIRSELVGINILRYRLDNHIDQLMQPIPSHEEETLVLLREIIDNMSRIVMDFRSFESELLSYLAESHAETKGTTPPTTNK